MFETKNNAQTIQTREAEDGTEG